MADNRRLRIKIIVSACIVALLIGGLVFFSTKVKAEDPTGVHLTVYQTDLMTGAGGSTATVFTDAAGKTVDIVGNPDVFGQGTVAAATYKRIRFSVKNLVDFTGPDPCTHATVTSLQFRIDGTKADADHVDLYFATADDGGSSGWTANGTAATPFLIQNPIIVEANATVIVKLIFNTTNTLQCIGGGAKVLGPTMNAMYYVDKAPATAGYCSNLGDYWFFHYRISSYPTDSTGSLITNPTLTQIMSSGQVVSGWGTLTFTAPDSTGTGTWSINPAITYETGGMAEHRHNLYMYSTGSGDGYLDPSGGTFMSAPYLLKGNKMLMTFPGQFTIDGAMATDCSTFVGVNLDQKEGSDLIVALKKTAASTTPTFTAGSKMVMVGPQVNMAYAAVAPIVNYFGYDSGWSVIQVNSSPTTSDGKQMEWKNRFEMSPNFASSSWSIRPTTEDASYSSGLNFNNAMTIAAGGLITQMNGTVPEDFIAVGANGNIIMAGEQTDVSSVFPGTHRIAAGTGVRIADSATLNDIVGKWSIGMLESRVTGTTDWGTGVSYGDMTISIENTGLAQACGGFMYRDNFSSQIEPPAPGCVQVQLRTECYAGQGVVVTTTPCTSGISVPVFYIMGTGPTGAPRVDTKFVLDYNKNVIVIWNSFDSDEIPCDSGNPSGCTPDPRNKTGAGIGVKTQ